MARDTSGVRDRILDAAVQLLRTTGVKALTQPQVAKAAGVLQSHLTYYFPKRTDLLLAVARHSVLSMGQDLHSFFATQAFPHADADSQARVLALIRAMVTNLPRTRMVLGLVVEADEDPALKAVMVEQVGVLRGLVALGIRRQLDDPAVDVVLATLWGLGLQHLILSEKRGEAYTDAIIESLPAWLAALPPPPPERPAEPEKPATRKKR
jgi:AcrR family transcriptional regulator